MEPKDPPEFERFIAAARHRPEIWRLAVGLVMVFFIATLASVPAQSIFRSMAEPAPLVDPETECAAYESLVRCIAGRKVEAEQAAEQSPRYVLLLLGFFAVIPVGLWLIMPVLHRRRFRTLIGPVPLAIRQFFACLLVLAVLLGAIFVLPPWWGPEIEPNIAFGNWLLLLPLALGGLLIQTGAEEILFRGYILQQMAVRTASRLGWMVVPSVLFGFMHYDESLGSQAAWAMMLWATFFGIAAADLTWRSGSLGPAIALHFANNANSLLFVSLEGPLSGMALYVMPMSLAEMSEDLWLFIPEFMVLLICWLGCRLALRR